jgi:hypothetical protein
MTRFLSVICRTQTDDSSSCNDYFRHDAMYDLFKDVLADPSSDDDLPIGKIQHEAGCLSLFLQSPDQALHATPIFFF